MASEVKEIKTVDPRHGLGRRGEDLAADFFIRRGFQIVARNWKCRRGELDLVICRGLDLRVIEVKTRQKAGPAGPQETVRNAKLSKIWEAAARFSEAHPELPDEMHVDVFTVSFTSAGVPVYRWMKDFE
jgi:putative endonuclease